jgi:hypothetical protein
VTAYGFLELIDRHRAKVDHRLSDHCWQTHNAPPRELDR